MRMFLYSDCCLSSNWPVVTAFVTAIITLYRCNTWACFCNQIVVFPQIGPVVTAFVTATITLYKCNTCACFCIQIVVFLQIGLW